MSYKVAKTKTEGISQLKELVNSFNNEKKSFSNPKYNETQLRNDFIDPFLMSFGWDVDNESSKTQFQRDVIQEEFIDIEDATSKKNPDYTLRIQGQRKLFVEAKKPSIDIIKSTSSAFQIRRYGWNASLSISILTNFDKLIIYDCRFKPNLQEDVSVARLRFYDFSEYITFYEEIYELISFESVSAGMLEEMFSVYDRVGQTFDEYFLQQIESWREKLAISVVKRNPYLEEEDVNFLIQRLLNRIIFLRICEDRTIEKYETLKKVKNYDELKSLFINSDKKYNSGLFNFIEDNQSLNIELDSEILIEIFNELYYPKSPFDFAVVDPSILSQIYEKFLGSHVVIDKARQMSIVPEMEVVASNGVVPTPKFIVNQIVNDTLLPLVIGKNSQIISKLKIADICSGSGTFLISVFDFLLETTIKRFIEEKITDTELIYEIGDNIFALTLKAKRNVLEQNIYGVDINPYAVEVTEFSLLLKLLEGETADSIEYFINQYEEKVLPNLRGNIKCGNSLVDQKFFDFMPEAINDNGILFRVKPFEWGREFPFLNNTNGFDAIVGNPPYVRIQHIVKFAPEEIKYYQNKISGFSVAKSEAVDKYYVFIQRAIELLNQSGILGFIVPHKFFLITSGKELRRFVSESCNISEIIHFGVAQVFPNRSTYTAILIIQKEKKAQFKVKRVSKITLDLIGSTNEYDQADFHEEPWIFLLNETKAIFNKIKLVNYVPLESLADICVGVQTSKDKIYIFRPIEETEGTYIFNTNGTNYEIEKNICLPCIYDLYFDLYDTIQPNAQMIFPYFANGERAELMSEEYFNDNYPLCWAYLNSHKIELEKRKLSSINSKWYEFGRSQSLTRFHDTPKLIWKVLSTKPTYVFDELNIQFTGGGNGPYYSLINNSEYSIYYLFGILAHPLFESMVKAGASEFRGAYYSHGKQFLLNIPIKVIDFNNPEEIGLYNSIIESVITLIETKREYNTSNIRNKVVLQRKMDILNNSLLHSVNKLYNITTDDFNKVMQDEMFTNDLIVEE